MELRRTANAGFLLTLDGVTIAMDGVCLAASPYQATPPAELARLSAAPPDLLAYTHCHADHFDPDFAATFCGPILGPEQVAQALPGKQVTDQTVAVGGVLKRYLTPQTLDRMLHNELCPKEAPKEEDKGEQAQCAGGCQTVHRGPPR